MDQEQSLESELKELAKSGCGCCFPQDCDWPLCCKKASKIKTDLDGVKRRKWSREETQSKFAKMTTSL